MLDVPRGRIDASGRCVLEGGDAVARRLLGKALARREGLDTSGWDLVMSDAIELLGHASIDIAHMVLELGEAMRTGGEQGFATTLVGVCVDRLGAGYADVTRASPSADVLLAWAGQQQVGPERRWPLVDAEAPMLLRAVSPPTSPSAGNQIARLVTTVRPWLTMCAGRALAPAHRPLHPSWRLTPAQRRVLDRLSLGHSNKDIAQALGCSVKTVEAHVSRLLKISRQPNRASLIRAALSS